MKRVVIIGAGIAGLATARALSRLPEHRAAIDVVVLDRAARPGGNIHTERIEGHLCEWGPHGFLDNAPATRALIEDLGLGPRVVPASDAAGRRFILFDGKLRELPRGPGGLLFGPLLTPFGRARLLAEPFIRRRNPADEADETIATFARRRLGREVATRIVGPAISGIFAGDPAALSLRAAFPELFKMERDHGGLLRGMLAGARQRRSGGKTGTGRLSSFTDGMGELVGALAREAGGSLRLASRIIALERSTNDGAGYTLKIEGASPIVADAIVLAGHAHATAPLLDTILPVAAARMRAIPTAPLAVVCMGWPREAVGKAFEGFGFLLAREEKRRTLGILFESNVFPGRCAADRAMARAMIGGALDPQAHRLSDDDLLAIALADLAAATGLTSSPDFFRVFRHGLGIPQYTVGHLARVAAIEESLASLPGLFLAGSSYRGVSINACVADASPVASRVLRFLGVESSPQNI